MNSRRVEGPLGVVAGAADAVAGADRQVEPGEHRVGVFSQVLLTGSSPGGITIKQPIDEFR